MKRNASYWIDENENMWDVRKYTEAEAEKMSATLKNCSGCIDCIDCTDCVDCVNCIRCSKECDGCFNCVDCVDCFECHNCVKCVKCGGCERCKNAEGEICKFDIVKEEVVVEEVKAVAETKRNSKFDLKKIMKSAWSFIRNGLSKSEALKKAWKVAKMIAFGGREWMKSGKHRIYFNTDIIGRIFNIEVENYKSGNIRCATMNGERISNAEAGRYFSATVYYDVVKDRFECVGSRAEVICNRIKECIF